MSVEHLVHMLRAQGSFCASSGSPMYGDLFELVASDVEAGGVFADILSGHRDAPSRDAIPLRLLGGLHRLVLDGRAGSCAAGIPAPAAAGTPGRRGRRSWPPRPSTPPR